MAERRMFAKTIIDSDAFLDMPLSTQALYFHLSMRADDDGFLNNANKIMRTIGANQNDYDLLVSKRFIIQFEDGICVIKHWRIHNYIQPDRYKPTIYKDEKALLEIKANKSYTLDKTLREIDNNETIDAVVTECIQNGYSLEAQVRLGKDSIGKDNINNVQISKPDIDTLFDSMWKLYPNKKGKGQISDTKKKALYKIGIEELTRAIERYKKDLAKETWRKPQNGSTFFNNGYVDYLDTNYEPSGKENKDGCTRSNADGFVEEALKAGISTEFSGFGQM